MVLNFVFLPPTLPPSLPSLALSSFPQDKITEDQTVGKLHLIGMIELSLVYMVSKVVGLLEGVEVCKWEWCVSHRESEMQLASKTSYSCVCVCVCVREREREREHLSLESLHLWNLLLEQ